jgi:hypothetical protein
MTDHEDPIAEVRSVLGEFAIPGELLEVAPFERGHIHDTYVSTWRAGGAAARYIHQRINDRVFGDVPGLMHNIEAVTRHLAGKLGAAGGFQTLRLVPSRCGAAFLVAPSGPWRTYHFIENSASFDVCESEEHAYRAARAFGEFQAHLIDLDLDGLRETIPHFFSSPHRMVQFRDALDSDPLARADAAETEVSFALERRPMVSVMAERMRAGAFPRRTVHGDTKLNNVLFDRTGGEAVCIVDLDTCMPAYSLYDFGDLVRFTAATSAEDERDLSLVGTDLDLYRALARGYLDGAGGFLTAEEVELMPFAARLVTFTIGLRFLTDHLAGDVYFKTTREGHNLDRARVQFGMVAWMEAHERELSTRAARS